MGIAGMRGGAETGVEAGAGFVCAGELKQELRGHLEGGYVVGCVLEDGVVLGECLIGVAFGGVGHGEAVAGESVGRVLFEDLGEGGDLVHGFDGARGARRLQAGGELHLRYE